MKKNNRGFTLVELLAVIVILLAISVVAIPSISAAVERSKQNTLTKKKQVLAAYGDLYFSEHQEISGSIKCVPVQRLKQLNYASEEELKNPLDESSEIGGSIKCTQADGCVWQEGGC